jgi:hypothetical protein
MTSNFRDITPCCPLKVNRSFGGTYCYLLHAVFLRGIFEPEDGGDMFFRIFS